MVIDTPRIRGSICLNTHPAGCAAEVDRQIEYVRSRGAVDGPKGVLVVGASTGYGLAARIAAAFGSSAATVGVAFEKPGTETRPGTPGWYNVRAFEARARETGLFAETIFGDAFSDEIKSETIEAAKRSGVKIDLVVYSLASGVRTDPADGVTYRSVLKPLGGDYSAKSIDFMKGTLTDFSVGPATEEETANTVKVMGGEDWTLWIDALMEAGVLADGCKTVAFSYIGPEITFPVYREGTIGKAKEHLEASASSLTERLTPLKGEAFVSVNKAVVTRASAVIPVVPLYISILFKIMKQEGTHEGCIEQMYRLFKQKMYGAGETPVDEEGRIRLDDLEMRDEIQRKVMEAWDAIDEDSLDTYADVEGYRQEFLAIHGFDIDGVDYSADVATD